MNLELLAKQALALFNAPHGMYPLYDHGFEIAPGFFTVHNDATGQSKKVLYHPESGYVFKYTWANMVAPKRASKRNFGTVVIDNKEYRVRLPEFYVFEKHDQRAIEVQEYVTGAPCDCPKHTCDHTRELRTLTGCTDTHRGNWKICNDEIVLFDFDGTPNL